MPVPVSGKLSYEHRDACSLDARRGTSPPRRASRQAFHAGRDVGGVVAVDVGGAGSVDVVDVDVSAGAGSTGGSVGENSPPTVGVCDEVGVYDRVVGANVTDDGS